MTKTSPMLSFDLPSRKAFRTSSSASPSARALTFSCAAPCSTASSPKSETSPSRSSPCKNPCDADNAAAESLVPVSFAEHAHPGLVAVLAVHVHGQIFKVIDQFFKVLRLDLRERKRHAVTAQRFVKLVVSLLRNQRRQPHSSTQ